MNPDCLGELSFPFFQPRYLICNEFLHGLFGEWTVRWPNNIGNWYLACFCIGKPVDSRSPNCSMSCTGTACTFLLGSWILLETMKPGENSEIQLTGWQQHLISQDVTEEDLPAPQEQSLQEWISHREIVRLLKSEDGFKHSPPIDHQIHYLKAFILDQLFDPINHKQPSFFIKVAKISRVDPAFTVYGQFGCLWIVVVA